MDGVLEPVLWLPLLFLPAFLVLWCAILALLSTLGGWRSLARHFRGQPQQILDSVGFVSGTLGRLGVRYRGCLSVSVGPAGIGLSVWPLFRVLHPPLLIPWQAIERCEVDRMLGGWERVRLEVREPRVPITLYGRAAHLVRVGGSALQRIGAGRPEQAK